MVAAVIAVPAIRLRVVLVIMSVSFAFAAAAFAPLPDDLETRPAPHHCERV